MNDPRSDAPQLFAAFLKLAQHVARLRRQQDIWEDLGRFIVTHFPAEWAAFIRRDSGGRASLQYSTLDERGAASLLTGEVRAEVADVLDSGFLASHVTRTPAPSMTVFLPIPEEGRTERVLLIGHGTASPLPKELLDIYLAIAGLAGSACVRLENEQELHEHRTRLEGLVRERTAELAQARHENELILQSIGEGICGLDPAGRIAFANPAAARLLGWSVEDLIGRDAHATFHHVRPGGGGYPEEDCPIHAALRGEPPVRMVGEEFSRKDRTHFPVEVTTTPIVEDGQVVGAVMAFRDVTERRETEDSLLKEKAFSETAINSLPGVFYLFDETGTFLRWNRNFEEVSGYSSREFAALHPVDFFEGDDRRRVADTIERVFATGEGNVEANLVCRDGRRIPYYFVGFRMVAEGRAGSLAIAPAVVDRVTPRMRPNAMSVCSTTRISSSSGTRFTPACASFGISYARRASSAAPESTRCR